MQCMVSVSSLAVGGDDMSSVAGTTAGKKRDDKLSSPVFSLHILRGLVVLFQTLQLAQKQLCLQNENASTE